MRVICKDVSEFKKATAITSVEEKYGIKFPEKMVAFFKANNGGIPDTREIMVDGREYEIRCFLSFNEKEYNSIHQPIESYQKETNGKIVPIAIDSGDNYFCLNLETGNIYYNDYEDGLYYKLFNNFSELIDAINDWLCYK